MGKITKSQGMSEKELLEVDDLDVDEDVNEFDDNQEGAIDDSALFKDSAEEDDGKPRLENGADKLFEIPEFTRKDKTLNEILNMMEDNPPIIPDAVIDYYLTRNGFDCADVRVKRLLALATQKFVSDIATDAYEYSRIRSAITVHNSNNGQARARQLILGQQQPGQLTQQQQQQNERTKANKVVLTVNDLSSAVSEYGLNIARPDFYR